ncbi:MAG: nucleotide exchange factor GrpE [Rhodospirillaceae bacterium]
MTENPENTIPPETPQPEAATPEPAPEPTPEDRIAALEAEAAKLKDAYVRAHAEMENLRKRAAAEIENRSRFALQAFAKDILPVADNLQRALSAVPQDDAADETVKNLVVGLEMTEKGLQDVLDRYAIHAVPGVGAPFDPHVHQAVQEIEDASVPSGTVVQVFQPGYLLHDRLLRAAMVVVSKGGPKGDGLPPGGPGQTVDTQA